MQQEEITYNLHTQIYTHAHTHMHRLISLADQTHRCTDNPQGKCNKALQNPDKAAVFGATDSCKDTPENRKKTGMVAG